MNNSIKKLLRPLLYATGPLWPDRTYLEHLFNLKMDYKLDLDNPVTYNQKLQWLKLYYRKPEFSRLVDKYAVKDYISDVLGEEYVIPTLGVWSDVDDIDFDALPDSFVLKTTHDTGGVVVCPDKSVLNRRKAKAKLRKSLKRDFYTFRREWPYKNVKPQVIAEPYIVDSRLNSLPDYKFFCFNGEPKILFVATERQNKKTKTRFDFFDMDYNHLDLSNGRPHADVPPEKPVCFEKMKEIASILSKGFPHIRVDFYEADGKIWFGELTFFWKSGYVPFAPKEWDYKMGEWIVLPEVVSE